jgi:hypothetical protein
VYLQRLTLAAMEAEQIAVFTAIRPLSIDVAFASEFCAMGGMMKLLDMLRQDVWYVTNTDPMHYPITVCVMH